MFVRTSIAEASTVEVIVAVTSFETSPVLFLRDAALVLYTGDFEKKVLPKINGAVNDAKVSTEIIKKLKWCYANNYER